MMTEDILGVVLAGGKSSRMGRNKATLPYNGKYLIDNALDILAAAGLTDLCISGKINGYNYIADSLSEKGPVGGIYSVISEPQYNDKKYFLIIPVDMPLLTGNLLRQIIHRDADGCCFVGQTMPLFLKHSHQLKEIMLNVLAESRSIKDILSRLKICEIPILDGDKNCFCNINTPEQWEGFQ